MVSWVLTENKILELGIKNAITHGNSSCRVSVMVLQFLSLIPTG